MYNTFHKLLLCPLGPKLCKVRVQSVLWLGQPRPLLHLNTITKAHHT